MAILSDVDRLLDEAVEDVGAVLKDGVDGEPLLPIVWLVVVLAEVALTVKAVDGCT